MPFASHYSAKLTKLTTFRIAFTILMTSQINDIRWLVMLDKSYKKISARTADKIVAGRMSFSSKRKHVERRTGSTFSSANSATDSVTDWRNSLEQQTQHLDKDAATYSTLERREQVHRLKRYAAINGERYSVAIGKARAACARSFAPSSSAAITPRIRYSLRSIVHKLISAKLLRHDHSIIACSRHIYYCSSRTSRSWWITHSTQRYRRGCNSSN